MQPTLPDTAGVVGDPLPASVAGLMRSLVRFKQQVHQAKRGSLEWIYDAILIQVVAAGPLRASALADLVGADPSTVSRQIAALVADGLIDRRPDPEDGRATLLSVTPAGVARHASYLEERDRHFGEMLADWSAEDRDRFAVYLRRFTADFDAYKDVMLATMTG